MCRWVMAAMTERTDTVRILQVRTNSRRGGIFRAPGVFTGRHAPMPLTSRLAGRARSAMRGMLDARLTRRYTPGFGTNCTKRTEAEAGCACS